MSLMARAWQSLGRQHNAVARRSLAMVYESIQIARESVIVSDTVWDGVMCEAGTRGTHRDRFRHCRGRVKKIDIAPPSRCDCLIK